MNKTHLAIFDLDGTLFSTKDVNYNAYQKALEKCGIDINIDYEYYCDFCNGNSYRTFLPKIIPGISEDELLRIHKAKKILYKDYLDLAIKNEHLFNMIDLMSSHYVIAIATTASRDNTIDILKRFDVEDKFDYILTKEDVENPKPSPEIFEALMKMTGISKSNTIIFEDSETGLEAAYRSGASIMRIYGFN